MPRTAEAKLTSEERCRKAFEAWIGGGPVSDEARLLRMGWNACWRYLQDRVQKEFIEK